MKARKLLEHASYDPDTLKALGDAFDQAWASVAHQYGSPLEIERARLRLANALLAVASQHEKNVQALADAALQRVAIKSGPGDPFSR